MKTYILIEKFKACMAELIGTALLMFFGCMGIISWGHPPNHFQACFNLGIVVVAVIQIFGCVSGSLFNPALSVAAWVYKRLSAPMAIFYIICQVVGALIGFYLLKLVTPPEYIKAEDAIVGLCTTAVNPKITVYQALAIEYMATAGLVLVCCGVWDPRNNKFHDSVGIKFGLVVFMLVCSCGPYTGCGMNPARSFAPAVFNEDYEHHWIYWVGPMSAALTVASAYKVFFRKEEEEMILCKEVSS